MPESRRSRPQLVAAGIAMLISLAAVACGSDEGPAPTAVPTQPPPAPIATAEPAPTTTPVEPTAAATPGPDRQSFADGRITVVFQYRSDPALSAAIDVVDVESILASALDRIDSLLPGPDELLGFRINIEITGPNTSGLDEVSRNRLETLGFAAESSLLSQRRRMTIRINPDGSIEMKHLWNEMIPSVLANMIYHPVRQVDQGGTTELHKMVTAGLAKVFEEEAFPGLEERMRKHLPKLAEVYFDLSAEGEQDVWAAAESKLDDYRQDVLIAGRYGSELHELSDAQGVEFPVGAGTSVSRRMILSYMANNPGATASSLAHTSAQEIFQGSAYSP